MDKKGEERIFTIWWFVAVVLISAAIILATLGFFSKETDTKEYEAGILYERIMECLVQNGHLRSDFEESFDIYKNCNLEEKIFSENTSLYFEISLDDNLIMWGGDKSLRADCMILKNNLAQKLPSCVSQSEPVVYYLDDQLHNAKISVMTSSSQASNSFGPGGKNE